MDFSGFDLTKNNISKFAEKEVRRLTPEERRQRLELLFQEHDTQQDFVREPASNAITLHRIEGVEEEVEEFEDLILLDEEEQAPIKERTPPLQISRREIERRAEIEVQESLQREMIERLDENSLPLHREYRNELLRSYSQSLGPLLRDGDTVTIDNEDDVTHRLSLQLQGDSQQVKKLKIKEVSGDAKIAPSNLASVLQEVYNSAFIDERENNWGYTKDKKTYVSFILALKAASDFFDEMNKYYYLDNMGGVYYLTYMDSTKCVSLQHLSQMDARKLLGQKICVWHSTTAIDFMMKEQNYHKNMRYEDYDTAPVQNVDMIASWKPATLYDLFASGFTLHGSLYCRPRRVTFVSNEIVPLLCAFTYPYYDKDKETLYNCANYGEIDREVLFLFLKDQAALRQNNCLLSILKLVGEICVHQYCANTLMFFLHNLVYNPGKRNNNLPVIVGQSGLGKSFFFNTLLGGIFGENYGVGSGSSFAGEFVSIDHCHKLLVVFEEIGRVTPELWEKTKQFIGTVDSFLVNRKHKEVKQERLNSNMIWISNNFADIVSAGLLAVLLNRRFQLMFSTEAPYDQGRKADEISAITSYPYYREVFLAYLCSISKQRVAEEYGVGDIRLKIPVVIDKVILSVMELNTGEGILIHYFYNCVTKGENKNGEWHHKLSVNDVISTAKSLKFGPNSSRGSKLDIECVKHVCDIFDILVTNEAPAKKKADNYVIFGDRAAFKCAFNREDSYRDPEINKDTTVQGLLDLMNNSIQITNDVFYARVRDFSHTWDDLNRLVKETLSPVENGVIVDSLFPLQDEIISVAYSRIYKTHSIQRSSLFNRKSRAVFHTTTLLISCPKGWWAKELTASQAVQNAGTSAWVGKKCAEDGCNVVGQIDIPMYHYTQNRYFCLTHTVALSSVEAISICRFGAHCYYCAKLGNNIMPCKYCVRSKTCAEAKCGKTPSSFYTVEELKSTPPYIYFVPQDEQSGNFILCQRHGNDNFLSNDNLFEYLWPRSKRGISSV